MTAVAVSLLVLLKICRFGRRQELTDLPESCRLLMA